jgi:hypothetical protein
VLYGLLILGLTIVLVLLSAWLRVGHVKKRKRLSLEPQDSFLSAEVKNVVANAGGIYVSLNLAASFLKLDVSHQFALLGVHFDVLAAFSLVIALVQPLIWPNKN